MPPRTPNPLHQKIAAAVEAVEKEMHGQLNHAATSSFSSVLTQSQQIEQAGNLAKAFQLLTQAADLVPAHVKTPN